MWASSCVDEPKYLGIQDVHQTTTVVVEQLGGNYSKRTDDNQYDNLKMYSPKNVLRIQMPSDQFSVSGPAVLS